MHRWIFDQSLTWPPHHKTGAILPLTASLATLSLLIRSMFLGAFHMLYPVVQVS